MKKVKESPMSFTLDFLLFCTFMTFVCAVIIVISVWLFREDAVDSSSVIKIGAVDIKRTVVIDAGHGGEDGGAVGKGEIYEKDINLDIALLVKEKLCAAGISVVMTREEDILLYDKNSDYKGHKKSQDLRKRLEIAESVEDCIFVSIHMNAFPDGGCRGLQVWYSKNTSGSGALAEIIQRKIKEELQTYNNRKIKAGDSSMYLLDRASYEAILIECGFLSNAEELAALSDETYRKKLADVISDSIILYMRKSSGDFRN